MTFRDNKRRDLPSAWREGDMVEAIFEIESHIETAARCLLKLVLDIGERVGPFLGPLVYHPVINTKPAKRIAWLVDQYPG